MRRTRLQVELDGLRTTTGRNTWEFLEFWLQSIATLPNYGKPGPYWLTAQFRQ
jgi:hypothetical protein